MAKKRRKKIATIPKVKVLLDTVGFSEKPAKNDGMTIGAIINRLKHNEITIDVESFAQQVVQPHGKSYKLATFRDDNTQKINWKEQQLIALDFDGTLHYEEALNRCNRYGILPSFAYNTFSDTDGTRFRLIFTLYEPIQFQKLYTLAIESLTTILPEADPNSKDMSHLFYGGQRILYGNYTQTIDLHALVFSTVDYINDKDKTNAPKVIKNYCENIGLNMKNGYPYIEELEQSSGQSKTTTPGCSEYTKNGENLLIYYRTFPKLVLRYTLHFSGDGKKETISRKTGEKKYSITNYQVKRRKKNENISLPKVYDSCHLYREFLNGERWLHHNELFGIATNLLLVKGGKKKLIEGLNSREEYSNEEGAYKLQAFKNSVIPYTNKIGYEPSSCKTFCPYEEECAHTTNILTTSYLPRGEVRILEEQQTISITESEERLKKYIEECLLAKKYGVYVVQADTGVGKTEQYIRSEYLSNIDVIALPTHDLKNEVAERLRKQGHSITVIPELPQLSHKEKKKLEHYYALGGYEQAAMYLHALAYDGNEELKEYFAKLEKARDSKGSIIVTTHERAIFDSAFAGDTVLFDEDILKTILKQDWVSLSDLKQFRFTIEDYDQMDDVKENLDILIQYIENMEPNTTEKAVGDLPDSILEIKTKIVKSILREKTENFIVTSKFEVTNVFDFLSCDYFYKDSQDHIYYIKHRPLQFKKSIILSATAHEFIYKKLYPKNLHFFSVGHTAMKGTLRQYLGKSLSKASMRYDEELVEFATSLVGNTPVITSKEFKGEFQNPAEGHFFNIAGTDSLKGQDIFVVGTPHSNPIQYYLYAAVLGIEYEEEKTKFKYQIVQYNGREFYFNTFPGNKEMQNLQLSLIETELLQAIGRARLVREDCTVTVLSNLPIQGADYLKFDGNEVVTKNTASEAAISKSVPVEV